MASVAGTDNTIPGCSSPAVQFVIDDTADNPVASIAETAQNTICDPTITGGNADGSLTVTISAGDLDSNYDVQWYLGTTGDTGIPINDTDVINNSTVTIAPATGVNGGQASVISGILEGTYWVQIDDNTTPNDNCVVAAEFTLTSNFTNVDLDIANVTANVATDCTTPQLSMIPM